MSLTARLVTDTPVHLFHLSARQRLTRVLRALGVALAPADAPWPVDGEVLLLRGDYLYDERLLRALAAGGPTLLCDAAGIPVAARLAAAEARAAAAALVRGAAPAGLPSHGPAALADAYQERLRKRAPPYLLAVTGAQRDALERRLYGGAYKGVTDLVTKFAWPRPALAATRLCARLGLTPNMVTLASVVLAVAAGLAFLAGEWGWGLAAGWLMTFLDTVDGKLARVTVRASRLGDVLDHGLDLLHPPLWYAAWGLGLAHWGAPGDAGLVIWVIVAGYVGGRLAEGAFQLWCAPFSLFVWRPFDSLNRLITARRNPNLLLLTPAAALGRPDWGLWLVGVWTVFSTLVLAARFAQALAARRRGPLRSWLTEIDATTPRAGLPVRLFAA